MLDAMPLLDLSPRPRARVGVLVPIHEQHFGDQSRIAFSGAMTVRDAVSIKRELIASIDKATTVEISLSEVTEIDTAGMQLLLLAKRHAEHAGKCVRFEGASDSVERLIRLYGLAGVFSDPALVPTRGTAP